MSPRGSIRLELESDRRRGYPDGGNPAWASRRSAFRGGCNLCADAGPRSGRGRPYLIEEALLLEPDALREHTLFTLNPDLVDRIHLRPATGEEILLARQGEGWTMLRPMPMPVESGEVARLMKVVPDDRVREFLKGAAGDAARAELDPPALRITFASFSSENTAESAAGETPIATLSFGRPRPDESLLVRLEEDNVVARVDADIVAKVATDPLAWQPLALFSSAPCDWLARD